MPGLSNPWPLCAKLPAGVAAVYTALHLREPGTEGLQRLSDPEWREALDFCDRSRLTLALRERARSAMPEWVRERTDRNAARNQERHRRIEQTYGELAGRLADAGIEFAALKGLTHCALFGFQPETRLQYDIDLLAPRARVDAAGEVFRAWGYKPAAGSERFPADHLPVMVRKFDWSGDYFDPEIPLAIDLHFQLWDERTERLRAPGTEQFWERRTARAVGDARIGMLSPADALGYAALHLLRHLLRGSANPFHVYELAQMLNSQAAKPALWGAWRGNHPAELRNLEAVAFRLAEAWFGCGMAEEAGEQIAQLSPETQTWFEGFSASPATSEFYPNKDELWLHLSLLESRRDAWSVARRRLLPGTLPALDGPTEQREGQRNGSQPARLKVAYAAQVARRAQHHTAALPRVALSGARWWWRANSLGGPFWAFLGAAVLFNFALFIFVLLYNLFLVDLGFREDFLGIVNGANRAGSLVGVLPAAFLAHRFGLRRALLASVGGVTAIELLRALVTGRTPVTVLSFAFGCIFALWAVVMAPVITSLVPERRRATAFSLFFASMFSVGVAGNWLGGRLPLWLHGKQAALLLAAGASAVALTLLVRLRPAEPPRETARIYPRGRFLARFLLALAVWNLATGLFNPFANVYFTRLHFSLARIGNVFSAAQLVQVITVLAAPWVIRRAGLAAGIGWMMLATAAGMGVLAVQTDGAAALVFCAYTGFQWMSEPGLNTLLMGRVAAEERGGASALNNLVSFGAQALAALAAGGLLVRFGYPVVLAGAAVLTAGAALLFGTLGGAARRRTVAGRTDAKTPEVLQIFHI